MADIDNPLKPILDVLQKKYGFDDRQIYELNVKKEIVKKGDEFIKLKINEIR
jgi:Holliday junction resolvase RusA-like endonuclease